MFRETVFHYMGHASLSCGVNLYQVLDPLGCTLLEKSQLLLVLFDLPG